MDDYVVVTSICSALAQHPQPAVHALLLDPAGALFQALKQAADKAKAAVGDVPDVATQMRAAKAALDASGDEKPYERWSIVRCELNSVTGHCQNQSYPW